MRFLQTDQELDVHYKVMEDCVPFINQACDSFVTCDPFRVGGKIRDLVDMCVIRQRRCMFPNEENQDLLAHLGAHRAVLRLLESMPKNVTESLKERKMKKAKKEKSHLGDVLNHGFLSLFHRYTHRPTHFSPQNPSQLHISLELEAFRSVYKGCYIFLSMFCSSNPRNQALLFPYLPLFVSHMGLGISAEEALIATFRG